MFPMARGDPAESIIWCKGRLSSIRPNLSGQWNIVGILRIWFRKMQLGLGSLAPWVGERHLSMTETNRARAMRCIKEGRKY